MKKLYTLLLFIIYSVCAYALNIREQDLHGSSPFDAIEGVLALLYLIGGALFVIGIAVMLLFAFLKEQLYLLSNLKSIMLFQVYTTKSYGTIFNSIEDIDYSQKDEYYECYACDSASEQDRIHICSIYETRKGYVKVVIKGRQGKFYMRKSDLVKL